MAAALAYYFVLSFFPALIFLSAVVACFCPLELSERSGPHRAGFQQLSKREDRPFWKTRPLALELAWHHGCTDTDRIVCDDCRSEIRRMVSWSCPPVECFRVLLALHPLLDCSRIHNPRCRNDLLPRPERKAAVCGNVARSDFGRWLLDCVVVSARHVFSPFRELQ